MNLPVVKIRFTSPSKRTTQMTPFGAALVLFFALGCELPPDPNPKANNNSSTPTAQATPEPPPQEMETVKAKTGVGKQGQIIATDNSPLATPVKVFFSVKQDVVFNIQLPQAMQVFQAIEGRNPNSQEEFDREIIEKNGIRLPELPSAHKYKYDPDTAQLMVVRPRSAATPSPK